MKKTQVELTTHGRLANKFVFEIGTFVQQMMCDVDGSGARPLLKKGLGGECDVRASRCGLGEEQD
jgi:hypothetical protein